MSDSKLKKSLEHIKEQHEEIYKACQNFGKLIHVEGGTLDEKTVTMVLISLSAANRNLESFRAHLYKAIELGCSFRDIEHAVFLTANVVGFPTMLEAHTIFREVADDKSPMKDIAFDNIITH